MTQVPVPNPALLQEWEEALLQAARQAEEARRTGRPLGPATGFPAVDAEIGGYLAPGLHVLLSAPGTGKTAMGLQIAGPEFSENRLLDAAHALEGAIGFDPRPPGVL